MIPRVFFTVITQYDDSDKVTHLRIAPRSVIKRAKRLF